MSFKNSVRLSLVVVLVLGFIAFQRSLSDGRSAQQASFERWYSSVRNSPADISLTVRGSREDGPFEWQIAGASSAADVSRATELALVAKLFNLEPPVAGKPTPAKHVAVEVRSGESRFSALVPESAVSSNVRLQTFLRYVMEHATTSSERMVRARGAEESMQGN